MNLSEAEYYEQVDLQVYYQELDAILPDRVLDFHTHVWRPEHWKRIPWQSDVKGGSYMVVDTNYDLHTLQHDGVRFFPNQTYEAVCFGYPIPSSADIESCNRYLSMKEEDLQHNRSGMYPLLLVHQDVSGESAEQQIREGLFFGYKICLPWHGNDYGDISVEKDMITAHQMSLANEWSLIVLLHLPRSGRLADPVNIASLRRLSVEYPEAQIVLAHCGRSYCPHTMQQGIDGYKDLQNVYFDVSMVQDPVVLQVLFDNVESARVLFGTDLPVAAMRGRRVCVNDHWVDVIRGESQGSGYRVGLSELRATFMVYEIVRAVRDAAELVGLSEKERESIFYRNGWRLLEKVRQGKQLQTLHEHWQ